MITPPATVTGAARSPLPYGLFSVLPIREGLSGAWEGGGVQFEGLGTPASAGVIGPFNCEQPSETPGLPKSFSGGLDLSTASVFTVYGSYKCSALGNPLSRAQEVARGRLDAWGEMYAERGLWQQLEATPAGELTDLGDRIAVNAIAEIETRLGQEYGALGVIHAGRGTALRLMKAGVVESKGTKLYTLLGTPVVAGSGYEEGEVYATPALFGIRSEVFTSSNMQGDLLDRGQNDIYAVAEQTYLIGYDQTPNILRAGIVEDSTPVTP